MKEQTNVKEKNIEEDKEETQDQDEPPSWHLSSHRKIVLDIETTDLHPANGQLICIGVKETDTGITRVFFDRNERLMVQRFIDFFNKGDFQEVIGYNLFFDTRFIFGKCLRYNIPMGSFYRARYNDLMQTVKSVKNRYSTNRPGSLNSWVKFIFGKSKTLKNASVPHLFHEGKISDIVAYNKMDVTLTHMLWKRVNLVLEGVENG
mgnify:CR=1 FL=1